MIPFDMRSISRKACLQHTKAPYRSQAELVWHAIFGLCSPQSPIMQYTDKLSTTQLDRRTANPCRSSMASCWLTWVVLSLFQGHGSWYNSHEPTCTPSCWRLHCSMNLISRHSRGRSDGR